MRHGHREPDPSMRALPSVLEQAEREHEATAAERVARTERGPSRPVPLAEHGDGRSCYVIPASGDVWTHELMDIDSRLRRWNRKRPIGIALSSRLD